MRAWHGCVVDKDLLLKRCRATYEFLYDVELNGAVLRRAYETGADLFSFIKRAYLGGAGTYAPYPYITDNIALLRISTYDAWWTKQITKKTGTWSGRQRRQA